MQRAILRKFTAILLAVSLMSSVLINAVAAQEEQAIEKTEIFASAYDAQLVGELWYVLLEDKLVSITDHQDEPTTIIEFSKDPELNCGSTLLFSQGTNLYAIDMITNTVYQVNGSALEQMVQLDVSDFPEKLYGQSGHLLVRYPVIQNEFLFMLCFDASDSTNKLYRFDLKSGKQVPLPINNYEFTELIAYRNGQLLGIDQSTQSLVAIDAVTGKAVDEIKIPSNYIYAIAYDSVGDQLYSLLDAQVVRWENQQPVTIDYLAVDEASQPIYIGIWNGHYTYVDQAGISICNTALETANVTPLTIHVSDAVGLLNSRLTSGFMKRYPQYPVIIDNSDGLNTMEEISTAITTKDASVDIFLVSNRQVDSKTLLKHGYAARLDSTLLQNDVLSMHPQIQDYLLKDGNLYGFPADLWPQYWTVQPKLLEEAELGATPSLIEDYLDMMLLWYENNGSNPKRITFNENRTIQEEWCDAIDFLCSQYVYTFASNDEPLSFNTPVFRAALEKLALLAKWKDQEPLRDDSQDIPQSIFRSSSIAPFAQSVNPEYMGEQYILPPAFAQAAQPILDTTLVYFMVNPFSQNQEAAVRFLEFYSENMELWSKYQLHPNYNELVEKKGYDMLAQTCTNEISAIKDRIAALEDEAFLQSLKEELAQKEADFAQEEKNRWVYSAEEIAQCHKFAPFLRMEHGNLLWAISEDLNIQTILFKYLEGHVPLDQALAELDRKASMMFLERQ
ncbi:MAG: hypothetical protein RR824_01280 [Clostridia bacterium]